MSRWPRARRRCSMRTTAVRGRRRAAGTGTPQPRPAGDALVTELPQVPVRPLSDYRIGGAS